MKEEDSNSNWFSKWEDELPSPEDLIPISQSLITPDLALAFNIPSPHQTQTPPQHVSSSHPNSSAEFDSQELSSVAAGPSGGSGSDELARTLKRPRLVWTPQLHKRFVDAVAHLGIKNAVPKTIMQLMSVDGLTRENVASHLQKYRLYLKRMQGMSNSGGSPATGMDPATDHLFASSPVPPHLLHPNRGESEHFMPFVPPHHHHLHHQMRVVPPLPHQFRQFGNGSPPNGQFEHPFLRHSNSPAQVPRISSSATATLMQQQHNGNGSARPPVYFEDLEPTTNGRKVLTLFPTGDDDS